MRVSNSTLDVTYSPKVGSSVTMTGEYFLFHTIEVFRIMNIQWFYPGLEDDGASTVNTTITSARPISSAVPCLDISDDGTTSKIVIPNIDLTSAQGAITASDHYAPARKPNDV